MKLGDVARNDATCDRLPGTSVFLVAHYSLVLVCYFTLNSHFCFVLPLILNSQVNQNPMAGILQTRHHDFCLTVRKKMDPFYFCSKFDKLHYILTSSGTVLN